MFDFLPPATAAPFTSPPLVRALIQIRFDNQRSLGTVAGATDVHELVADRYPRLLTEQQALITAGPTGVSSDFAPQYRMTDLDETSSVVLATDHVTFETSGYTDWREARTRFDEVISAVSEVANLRVAERIGLRYVNHFPIERIESKVNGALLASLQEPGLREYLGSSAGQLVLHDNGAALLVRCGISRSNGDYSPFLLDIDCATSKPTSFDRGSAFGRLDDFNDVAFRFFMWSITKDYRDRLVSGERRD